MFTILVAEDDKNSRKLMTSVLTRSGFSVLCAPDGEKALEILDEQHVDLLLLDVMMPNMNGYELAEELRTSGSNIPILMISARQGAADKKRGFLVGTDDYMTKPVDEEEMLLRINALLRRAQIVNEHRLHVGRVTLDFDALTVRRADEEITLPQKEFYLLYKLLSYPNIVFTRLQLMDEIWGMNSQTDEHTVNVHINRLRERFKNYPEFEIVTVRGLGYKAVKNV
jgi:DNA-binding response OmpR family regulator